MTEISVIVMEVEGTARLSEPSRMISVEIDGDHTMATEMLAHIESFSFPGRRVVIR